MRQQGAQQPVSVYMGGWEELFHAMCECLCAYKGGAIFKGCWEGNRSVFLGLHRQKGLGRSDPGLNNLSPILHGAKKCRNGTSRWYRSFSATDRCVWLQTSPHPPLFSWGSLSMLHTPVVYNKTANNHCLDSVVQPRGFKSCDVIIRPLIQTFL